MSTKSHVYSDGWCLEIYDETSDERGARGERPVRIAASDVDDLFIEKLDGKYEIEFSVPPDAIKGLVCNLADQADPWWNGKGGERAERKFSEGSTTLGELIERLQSLAEDKGYDWPVLASTIGKVERIMGQDETRISEGKQFDGVKRGPALFVVW